jgi:hypothetical protein
LCEGGVVYVSLVILYKVLCGKCGIRQSSCIILKYCVRGVAYVSLVVFPTQYFNIIQLDWRTPDSPHNTLI